MVAPPNDQHAAEQPLVAGNGARREKRNGGDFCWRIHEGELSRNWLKVMASRSRPLVWPLFKSKSASPAVIAALSVQYSSGGKKTGSESLATAARSPEFAATPPPMTTDRASYRSAARRIFFTSTSTAAD